MQLVEGAVFALDDGDDDDAHTEAATLLGGAAGSSDAPEAEQANGDTAGVAREADVATPDGSPAGVRAEEHRCAYGRPSNAHRSLTPYCRS